MPASRWTVALLVTIGCQAAAGLDNGFTTPAMGYSTWNDCASFRNNGPTGWCWDSEDHVKNVTTYMIKSGLAKLGYTQINVDEGWLKGRLPNGSMYEDLEKFPSGMKGLGDWIKQQPTASGSTDMMRYGLYSCRGTCQCGTQTYSAPGSHGYEKADVDFMVSKGAQYLKIDSCCGSQDHATAFSDYAKFRDAINATGQKVWFSLCGWEDWYSPPDPSLGYKGGASLGNSWRIAGDGSGWGPLTNCMNKQAAAAPYIGLGGWADPDLLIGPEVYVGGQTDQQARAQFTMWSIFPANLIISQNVLRWSDYALATYSNAELIAINQDPAGNAARRIVGIDMKFPCGASSGAAGMVQAVPCNSSDIAQQWKYDASTKYIESSALPGNVIDDEHCISADGSQVALYPKDNGSGTCEGKNQLWSMKPDGTIASELSGKCLDVYEFTGPTVDVWSCNGGPNQAFSFDNGLLKTKAADGKASVCLAAVESVPDQCTNVWGRSLSNGDFVLAFVNNNVDTVLVNCDKDCFSKLLDGSTPDALKVHDLWGATSDVVIKPPFSFSSNVKGSGFATAYRLSLTSF